MHIHLDPIGGLAGDMFAAALLDLRPDLASELPELLFAAGLPADVTVRHEAHDDGVLTGSRFVVSRDDDANADHAHVHFRALREQLDTAAIPDGVRVRAVAIFTLLAEAEGQVHGKPPEDVAFHEVGAWDSIADVVTAAHLIESLGAASWSTAPLPLGTGRADTAHGPLPVPAPATARLLEGLPVIDDGRSGERVTPTGAAILRHLAPSVQRPAGPWHLGRAGYGFGTRELPGMSNVLRALVLEKIAMTEAPSRVAVLAFEIDDQTAEDLAVGLDNVRAHPAVLDVVQTAAVGKKGRLVIQVRVLARPEAAETVADLCLTETATLGVRWHLTERRVLVRDTVERSTVRVKRAQRPDGTRTAKAEMDDLAKDTDGHAGRERRRRAAETAAAEGDNHD